MIKFLKARLEEKSTKAAIVAAIIGGAALPAPWSYIAVGVGILMAITPTTDGSSDA